MCCATHSRDKLIKPNKSTKPYLFSMVQAFPGPFASQLLPVHSMHVVHPYLNVFKIAQYYRKAAYCAQTLQRHKNTWFALRLQRYSSFLSLDISISFISHLIHLFVCFISFFYSIFIKNDKVDCFRFPSVSAESQPQRKIRKRVSERA